MSAEPRLETTERVLRAVAAEIAWSTITGAVLRRDLIRGGTTAW
ncbi:hypothetical protein ACIBCT_39600 [Streptosporangium sp. NPDC050855]